MISFKGLLRKAAEPENCMVLYEAAVREMTALVSDCDTSTAKLAMLDFLITATKVDLRSDGLWPRLHGVQTPIDYRAHVFPLSAECCTGKEQIDFSGKTVLATAWDFSRLVGAVCDIAKEGFLFEQGQHRGTYYPELELVVIQNGCHHTTIAAARGEGTVEATVYSLAPAFDCLHVERGYWHNAQTGSKLRVTDYRFAVLYELARMKHQLRIDMEG